MKIMWYGDSCFLLKGSKISVIVDPYTEDITKKININDVDLVLSSDTAQKISHNLVFDWPGEYETKGMGVTGKSFFMSDQKEVVSFILAYGKIRICHLGLIDRLLTDEEISSLGAIDVLFLPVGGKSVISAKIAHKILEGIDPRMVIPMCYSVDGDEAGNFSTIDEFKREMGIKEDYEEKESVEIKDLPTEQTDIVILSKN